jgi:hypothetical protein
LFDAARRSNLAAGAAHAAIAQGEAHNSREEEKEANLAAVAQGAAHEEEVRGYTTTEVTD